VWDLWWTEWHWDRFLSEIFGFPLSVWYQYISIVVPYSYYRLGDEQ
jgi:hypothetical protein